MPALAVSYDQDKPDASRTPHLLCGSRFWPLSATVGCAYLAWLAYSHLASHQVAWPADVWAILAYAVWILFLLVLITETRCLPERLLFAVFIANFTLGLAMAAAPALQAVAATARQFSLGLWMVGGVYSLSFMLRSAEPPTAKI